MSLMKHVLASLKKKKKDTISLAILIFLAVMLLNTGLAIQTTISDFYFQSNERIHAPHYNVCVPSNRYKDSYLEYLQNDPRVSEAEIRESAIMYGASYEVNGGEAFIFANFLSTDSDQKILSFSVIEESEADMEDAIYVPYFFKRNNYQIGDSVKFDYNGEIFSYQIKGYFETTWFGTAVNNMVLFYLPEDAYQDLYQQLGGGKLISARLNDLDELEAFRKQFKQDTGLIIETAGRDITSFDQDYIEMQSISIMIPNIMTAVMLIFSIIVFLIVVLVMRFRVYSHIEDNMKNIGVMEAIGYTTVQIRWVLVMEYLLVTVVGSAVGILASAGLIRLLGDFISGFIGVKWLHQMNLLLSLFTISLMVVLVMITTYLFTRKISKLNPIIAFRGGLSNHSFQKNYFPLNSSRSLQFQLACKSMIANLRQYLMVAVILVGVTAAAAFSFLLYSNMSGKDSAIYHAIGMETANVTVRVARHQDLAQLTSELLAMEEVRTTSTYFGANCQVEGRSESFYVSDDYSKLETVEVYEGEFPIYDNEIVISGLMAKSMNKKIGDPLSISYRGVSAEYIICGFTQTMNNLGRTGMLSLAGIRRINPSYEIMEVNIYLKAGYQTIDFIRKLEQTYGVLSTDREVDMSSLTPQQRAQHTAEEKLTKLLTMYGVDSADYSLSIDGEVVFSGSSTAYRIEKIDNLELFVQTSIGSFVSMVTIMVLGILVSTLFIVGLILVLIIRYMILRRRQEYGVMKSIGYTSLQIRIQLAFGFLPVSALGIIAGCVLATFSLNSVLNVLFAPMGISRLNFSGNPLLLGGLFIALMLYVFFIAFVSSRKVKLITPYELFVD